MRQLSIKNGPRDGVFLCGVRDENPMNHSKTHWCAGLQLERTARGLDKPSLFEIVRVYLEYLWRKDMLTDKTSHAVRIDLLYAVYAFLIWETNKLGGENGGSKRCPKLVHLFDGAAAINWRATVLEEGFSIGVPFEVYRSTGVLLALRAITTHRGTLLQAHCCTAHCTGPVPPAALVHSYLLLSPLSPGRMWQRSTSPPCARRSTPTVPLRSCRASPRSWGQWWRSQRRRSYFHQIILLWSTNKWRSWR